MVPSACGTGSGVGTVAGAGAGFAAAPAGETAPGFFFGLPPFLAAFPSASIFSKARFASSISCECTDVRSRWAFSFSSRYNARGESRFMRPHSYREGERVRRAGGDAGVAPVYRYRESCSGPFSASAARGRPGCRCSSNSSRMRRY